MKQNHWHKKHPCPAKPRPADGFKSSYERKFAEVLESERKAKKILCWKHESITLVVNDVEGDKRRYTPDFAVWEDDKTLHFFEVKGFAREDSILKFEVAARNFPHHIFTMVGWDKAKGFYTMKEYGGGQ
jgi:hypothetical protein